MSDRLLRISLRRAVPGINLELSTEGLDVHAQTRPTGRAVVTLSGLTRDELRYMRDAIAAYIDDPLAVPVGVAP